MIVGLNERIEIARREVHALERLVRDLVRAHHSTRASIQGVVTRGVLARVDDKKKVQRAQVDLLADETEEDVEIFQPQGLSFVPEAGAEAVVFAVGGDRAHSLAVCVQDPAKRPTGNQPGTGGLYVDKRFYFYVDDQKITHVGGDKSAKDFVALAQLVKDQFAEVRKLIDDKYNEFVQFANSHSHMVATAGSPTAQTGTAAPVTAPVVPSPPAGPATDVAATKTKAT